MKKLLLVFSVLFFASCDNSDTATTGVKLSDAAMKAQIESINAKYASTEQQRSFKSWCQIGVADVGGAWAGSWAGGKIGALFGPQGAGIGAVVGGVIVGAAASYGASRYAPGPEQGNIDSNIGHFNTSITYANPNNNPFDLKVGQRHNQVLQSLVTTNPITGPTDPRTLYNGVTMTADERTFYNDQSSLTLSFYSELKASNTTANLKTLLSRNIDDATLITLMSGYLEGMDSVGTFNDAISLSQDYEAYVMRNGSLSTTQKNVMLEGLATARYSLNMWYAVNQ
jgi:hypothetical protein